MKARSMARNCVLFGPHVPLVLSVMFLAVLYCSANLSVKTSVKTLCLDQDDADAGGGSSGEVSRAPTPRTPTQMKIQIVGPETEAKEVAWLGVSTEEVPDAVSSQLGLPPGDGLVVIFVQPDSPAAKAGLQKNDLLVELGDQLLVHPGQFRKLIRRQKEGDKIKLTLYRNAKKQTVAAILTKTTERASLGNSGREFWAQVDQPRQYSIHQPVAYLPQQSIHIDVQRNVDEARKTIREALMHNHAFAMALGSEATNVEALARSEVKAEGATVTVKKNAKSVRTIVKTDETGTYVIVANPRKRLTVHDKAGKIVFDGEIETSEQQAKIPDAIRPKAERMMEEMGKDNAYPEATPAAH
jgi:membrane-associated protease RseP (regulator of RpoE activity)